MRRWIGAALICATFAPSAAAEALTCEAFKARLGQTLLEPGASHVAPPRFVPDHDAGALGQRFTWTGIQGLRGRLTCGRGDAFADFYMTADQTPDPSPAGSADLARFSDLGAVSIEVLTDGSPEASRALMATMAGEGFETLKDDIAQGDDRPQGLRDYDLSPGLDAVFYVTPGAMSWAIGPGVFGAVDSKRPHLAPKDRDESE